MTTIADTQPTRFTKGETVISTRNANKFTFVSYLPDRDANGYDSVVRRDTHFMLADSRVLTAKPKLFSVGEFYRRNYETYNRGVFEIIATRGDIVLAIKTYDFDGKMAGVVLDQTKRDEFTLQVRS